MSAEPFHGVIIQQHYWEMVKIRRWGLAGESRSLGDFLELPCVVGPHRVTHEALSQKKHF